jgi:hypothetical protein
MALPSATGTPLVYVTVTPSLFRLGFDPRTALEGGAEAMQSMRPGSDPAEDGCFGGGGS